MAVVGSNISLKSEPALNRIWALPASWGGDGGAAEWLSRDPLANAETLMGPNLYAYCRNNPLIYFDPLGLATLYYWPSTGAGLGSGSGGNAGHVGLMLDDGTYISYFPDDGNLFTDFYPGVDTSPASLSNDIASENGQQPCKTNIPRANDAAIKAWWNNQQGHGPWSVFNNCSDIVADALAAGGVDIGDQSGLVSNPDAVYNNVNNYNSQNSWATFSVNGSTYTIPAVQ